MLSNNILYYSTLMFGWTIPFFLYKELTNYFTVNEIIVTVQLLLMCFLLPILIYNYSYTISFIKRIKLVPRKYLVYFIIISATIFPIKYAFISLFKSDNVSLILPKIRAFGAFFLIFFSYFVFNEKITILKCIGILLITLGIYTIHYK